MDRADKRFEARSLALVGLALGIAATLAVALSAPREGDPNVFLLIADPIAGGGVAYRDVHVEYPPLALLPIVLPRVIVGMDAPGEMYQAAFGAIALLTTLACGAAVAWLAGRGWSREDPLNAMLVFVGMALALTVSVIWRFDILPAALTAFALVAVSAGRSAWAGAALGLAVATKLYPGFLAPIFLAYYAFNREWRSVALFGVGMAISAGAVLGQIYLIAGADAFSFLTYQRDRGTEIESVVGSLALAADAFANVPSRVIFAFGSFEVQSRVVRALAVPDFVAQVCLGLFLVAAGTRAALRDRSEVGSVRAQTLVTYVVATLLLIMLANKVLSPQYVVWLLPFAALLPARQAFVLIVASVLTTLEYPLGFDALRAAEPVPVLILLVRNALLLVLFVWIVAASQRRDVREPARDARAYAEYEKHDSQPRPV